MDSISSASDFNPSQTSSSSSSSSSSYQTTLSAPFATVATTPPKRRAGRKKFRETRHPVYKGVRLRNGNKWVCEVREPNKKSRIWLGTFPTPEMAARAHDVAAMALRGRSACLNFADSVWLLPVPASANPKDIQKTATEAAEAFRPSESASVSDDEVEPESIVTPSPEGFFCMNDELNFGMDMPGLLASMAEGLLLPPPQTPSGFHWDDVEDYADVSLWSYSIPINY